MRSSEFENCPYLLLWMDHSNQIWAPRTCFGKNSIKLSCVKASGIIVMTSCKFTKSLTMGELRSSNLNNKDFS